jgi:hypothetical protein
MRIFRTLVLATAAGLVATAAAAQEASPPVTMAAYYRCDISRQERADTIYRQIMVPALDKQVQAGLLTGYGFYAHRIGGAWRRLDSWTGPDVEQVLAAQEAVTQEVNQSNPKLAAEFSAICGSHDDYMWVRILGPVGTPGAAPSAAPGSLYSRYFFCEDEATADMAMETVYEEMMNKHLQAGHITSWGWLFHYIGGTVRRVLNWSGPDVLSVLKAEEMISADMNNSYMWGPFSRGCNTHMDYVWTEVASR